MCAYVSAYALFLSQISNMQISTLLSTMIFMAENYNQIWSIDLAFPVMNSNTTDVLNKLYVNTGGRKLISQKVWSYWCTCLNIH